MLYFCHEQKQAYGLPISDWSSDVCASDLTQLAIERLLGHESGMIGFPLRLLARENYDRLVAAKGARAVALITGEEKILPADARYFVCTVESIDRKSTRLNSSH